MVSTGERLMARAVIMSLLKPGYAISVYDGEEVVLRNSTNTDQILRKMFSTCEDYLFVHPTPETEGRIGWVRFIYGNDPAEVVNDYTTNLESVLERAIGTDKNSIADRLERHERVTIADLDRLL
jgi:hypothetical protein